MNDGSKGTFRRGSAGRAAAGAMVCTALGYGVAWARGGDAPSESPIVYTGVLEEDGAPVTGTRPLGLALHDAATGGERLCSVLPMPVEVQAGRFAVVLGDECREAVRDGREIWVEVTVQGVPLAPRARIAAVPYALEATRASRATGELRDELDAMRAELAGKLDGADPDSLFLSPEGNVGIGTSSPSTKLQVGGDLRVGEVTPPGEPDQGPGFGAALIFSGGPSLWSEHGSENSDPVWIARYNTDRNSTEMRVTIGDDPGQEQDRFVIGAIQAGTWLPRFSVGMSGPVRAVGPFETSASPDIAETIPAEPAVEAGDAVCADLFHRERAVRCRKGDTAVLGVVAGGASGFLIDAPSPDGPHPGKPLVLAGRVPVKVSLENGPIRIGDFLALSSVPGVVMRSTGPGPVVGIALEPHDGRGGARASVLCFVKPGVDGIVQLAAQNAHLRARSAAIEAENLAIRAENAAIEERLARLEYELSVMAKQEGPRRPREPR